MSIKFTSGEMNMLREVNQLGPLMDDDEQEKVEVSKESDKQPVKSGGPADASLNTFVQSPAPNFRRGSGQFEQFADQHQIEAGRDWNFTDEQGILEIAENAVHNIKESVDGTKVLDDFLAKAQQRFVNAGKTLDQASKNRIEQAYEKLAGYVESYKKGRQGLLANLPSDFKKNTTTAAALSAIQKDLRVFRYQTQRALRDLDPDHTQKMGPLEWALRALQNKFTFSAHTQVRQSDISSLLWLEQNINDSLKAFNQALEGAGLYGHLRFEDNCKFSHTIHETLEISHLTNDQIRKYNMENTGTKAKLHNMLGELAVTGGTRQVKFEASAGALVGINFPGAAVAGLKADLKVNIIGEVKSSGKGHDLEVTYRLGGGTDLGVLAKLGSNEAGARAEAGGGVMLSKFVTRRYATLDDLIADADRCKMATTRTVIGAVVDNIKWVGSSIGALGQKFFRMLGRHAGEVVKSNEQYLNAMKERGVVNNCDRVLAERSNAMITGEVSGLTTHQDVHLRVAGNLGPAVNADASVNFEHQKDFRVKSNFFVPFANRLRGADLGTLRTKVRNYINGPIKLGNYKNKPDLDSNDDELYADNKNKFEKYQDELIDFTDSEEYIFVDEEDDDSTFDDLKYGRVKQDSKTENAGKAAAELEYDTDLKFSGAKNVAAILENEYDLLIEAAQQHKPADDSQWSDFANQIREIMIVTEMQVAKKRISRADGDRLLSRFSNPPVKIPPDIFREYLMEGSGSAKPPKIRNNFGASVSLNLFSSSTNGLTSEITSSVGKAVADAAIDEMRHQTGLDTDLGYHFSSEKPVKPGEDPRPWENTVKTTHDFVVTANLPVSALFHITSKLKADANKPLDLKSESFKKEVAKDIAADSGVDAATNALKKILPAMLISMAKEEIKAQVMEWLSDPQHIAEIVVFAYEHRNEAFNLICDTLLFGLEHHKALLEAYDQVKGYIAGSENLGTYKRNKVFSLNYVDGEFESIQYASEIVNKSGFDLEPLGVGIGLSLSMSLSVSERKTDKFVQIAPSLNTMMAMAESNMFNDLSINPSGRNEYYKNWMANNYMAIVNLMTELKSEKNLKLYQDALGLVKNKPELKAQLELSWQQVQKAVEDPKTKPFEKLDAMYDLVMAMTRAYRSALPTEEEE
ncbi:MAG: hypothetical protein K6F05_05860 [Succinivibrio sp.]|nr:hypothetical protein [Succinivibrio sp.]